MTSFSDVLKKARHNFCSVVVVAAGNSLRMGRDKLLLELDGVPVLARTLMSLNQAEAVDELLVVTQQDKLGLVAEMKQTYGIEKLVKAVIGGSNRTESALAGVSETDPRAKIICIHDGVRPFVTDALISDVVHYAVLYQSAAPAVPVKDTIKQAKDGVVLSTPDRSGLFAVQTPQAFHADIVKAALTAAVSSGISYTDDCAAVAALGVPTYLSRGSEDNIKITTPMDMMVAEAILKSRSVGI